MHWLWEELNLISLFSFYLALMFVFSLYRRAAQYRAIGGIVLTGPGRWPHLIELIKRNGNVFMTWSTFLPALVALALIAIQWITSKLVGPQALVTLGTLAQQALIWPFVALFAAGMLAVDIYFLVAVSEVDRRELQKYFDEAEYWLRSWTAPVVHILSLGRINPRHMVNVEVQKALVAASELLNTNLWWIVTQTGLRVAFGLALWLSYALQAG